MNKFNRLATDFIKLLKKGFKREPWWYIFILFILCSALFIRVYRAGDLMGFYYDQGRDALVIWKLWHNGKLFLIGPVSGLAGIFLGPFYYYLIAPLYLIGSGDPRFPAVFLSLLTVLALPVLYYLGWKMQSKLTGLIALLIGSFSYYLVLSGRWLSNPTPMFLTSILLLLFMWKISSFNTPAKSGGERLDRYWYGIAILIGLSLQFESASAVFYLPMILVFIIWQRKKLPQVKKILLCILIFLATLLPQIFFNIRHDNLIVNSFKRVLIEEKSFRNPLSRENLNIKIEFLWNVFNSKIFPEPERFSFIIYPLFLIGTYLFAKRNRNIFLLLLLFLGIPIIFYIVFQGNEGHIYDYYLTGYYLPMVLMFSLGLCRLEHYTLGKIIIVFFIFIFLRTNLPLIYGYLKSPSGGPGGIALGTETAAVDWVYGTSAGRGEFNVDVYVPPVIPYSYDYLFLWRGYRKCGKSLCGFTSDRNVPLLYTLYEEDIPHADRLTNWLERQKHIGIIREQIRFGGVTVQQRQRIK